MPVHHRVIPQHFFSVPNYTPGSIDNMELRFLSKDFVGLFSSLVKSSEQSPDHAQNHWPSDLKSNPLRHSASTHSYVWLWPYNKQPKASSLPRGASLKNIWKNLWRLKLSVIFLYHFIRSHSICFLTLFPFVPFLHIWFNNNIYLGLLRLVCEVVIYTDVINLKCSVNFYNLHADIF